MHRSDISMVALIVMTALTATVAAVCGILAVIMAIFGPPSFASLVIVGTLCSALAGTGLVVARYAAALEQAGKPRDQE